MEFDKLYVVCGARRTGTTLLAAILSSDTTVPPLPGEAQLLPRWLETFRWARDSFAIRALPFFADETELRDFYRGLLVEFLRHCRAHFTDSSRLVLKSPELSLFFPEAMELLPQARYLVMVRDPRDQAASEFRVIEKRRGSEEDLRILRERDFEALAREFNRYYQPIVELALLHADRIWLQRYEDLVLTPARSIAGLERFTGLDLSRFDPAKEWPRVGASYWAYGTSPSDTPFYGKAVERGRVGSYAESMTPEEAASVSRVCQAIASRLGYPLDRAAGG